MRFFKMMAGSLNYQSSLLQHMSIYFLRPDSVPTAETERLVYTSLFEFDMQEVDTMSKQPSSDTRRIFVLLQYTALSFWHDMLELVDTTSFPLICHLLLIQVDYKTYKFKSSFHFQSCLTRNTRSILICNMHVGCCCCQWSIC